jgi:hypothetical protein
VVGMDLFPRIFNLFSPGLRAGVHALSVLRTPSNHLQVLPTQKVLSTCPPAGATLASPLARQVPDTEPRDGPQIQIAKRLRREVRPNSSSQSYFTVSASASASGNRFFSGCPPTAAQARPPAPTPLQRQ